MQYPSKIFIKAEKNFAMQYPSKNIFITGSLGIQARIKRGVDIAI